ncbi:MAG TPA: rhodanese-like domain-containing protein [Acidimicrobiia bacterium]|nr:rhodanese-like domain-containing protein [Acidimicrobiia bacterium]
MGAPTTHPLRDDALGNTSYLVASNGVAVVIDPPRDVDRHLELADRLGVSIVATLDTHLHADYVSGGPEMAAGTGAEVVVPRDAQTHYPHRAVADGDRLAWNGVRLQAVATPGHTPEHLAYVLLDGDGPMAVFSGGSLIVGGAARTDLLGDDHTQELARAQFHSLRLLASLPDATALHPTHGVGSFCLAASSPVATPTIGSERRTNPLLQLDDEDAFVGALTAGFGTFPTYYRHLQRVNRDGPALVRDLEEPTALAPEAATQLQERGGWLVDTRSIHEWAAGHPRGAISIELRPAFASWLGWAVPFGAPVVLLVDEERHPEALTLARRIGYDAVVGWIEGGIGAWRAAGLPVDAVEEIGPEEARQRQVRGATLVDVRQRSELDALRLPGAAHLELGDIIAGKVPSTTEAITFCGHGERSATAASLLESRGIVVANLAGGIAAWEAAGFPVER